MDGHVISRVVCNVNNDTIPLASIDGRTGEPPVDNHNRLRVAKPTHIARGNLFQTQLITQTTKPSRVGLLADEPKSLTSNWYFLISASAGVETSTRKLKSTRMIAEKLIFYDVMLPNSLVNSSIFFISVKIEVWQKVGEAVGEEIKACILSRRLMLGRQQKLYESKKD